VPVQKNFYNGCRTNAAAEASPASVVILCILLVHCWLHVRSVISPASIVLKGFLVSHYGDLVWGTWLGREYQVVVVVVSRELKTTCRHVDAPVAVSVYWTCSPCRLFHFCMGMDSFTCGQVHVGTGIDLPAQTACWPTAIKAGWPVQLAYSQCDPLCSLQASWCWHGSHTRSAGQRDEQWIKHNAPAAGYAACSLQRGIYA